MSPEEALQWLYAIETIANDAGETGDFDLQEDCCDWYAQVRDGAFKLMNREQTA